MTYVTCPTRVVLIGGENGPTKDQAGGTTAATHLAQLGCPRRGVRLKGEGEVSRWRTRGEVNSPF